MRFVIEEIGKESSSYANRESLVGKELVVRRPNEIYLSQDKDFCCIESCELNGSWRVFYRIKIKEVLE